LAPCPSPDQEFALRNADGGEKRYTMQLEAAFLWRRAAQPYLKPLLSWGQAENFSALSFFLSFFFFLNSILVFPA
jgi:hypothetical protein